MKTLVIGGTGTVGSQVVKELLARKSEVYVFTRNAEKIKGLPGGTIAVEGDLVDPGALKSAMHGVDRVFMLLAVSRNETQQGIVAIDCARMAGVEYFVYMSVQNVYEGAHVPHFGSKIPMELVLKSSGMPYTILRPNNFYQNDLGSKDSLLRDGIYPQPIGDAGLSRVDVRDIAEAAAITLTKPGRRGRIYNIVGPRVYTGTSCAEVWSRALGRPVAYGGDDLDAWEKRVSKDLPAWKVFDYRLMYEYLQKEGLLADDGDVERLTELLGHPPRTFEDFARETAALWTGR